MECTVGWDAGLAENPVIGECEGDVAVDVVVAVEVELKTDSEDGEGARTNVICCSVSY